VSHEALRAVGYWSEQISPGDIAIMIPHRDVRVSFNMAHGKVDATPLQGMQQAAH
jgi:hypothetical protein